MQMWDNLAMGGAILVLRQIRANFNMSSMSIRTLLGRLRVSTALLAGLLFAAGHSVHAEPPAGTAAASPSQIAFYPTTGQNRDQQERDRYECFLAAARQARFDPSVPQLPAAYRFSIVASPTPLQNTAAQTGDAAPTLTTGADLGQRAANYRQRVRHCLVQRGYGVR